MSIGQGFPVTILERVVRGKGVGKCRRGDGKPVAKAAIAVKDKRLDSAKLGGFAKLPGADAAQAERARKVSEIVAAGLACLAGYAGKLGPDQQVLEQALKSAPVPVEFLDGHEWVMDVYPFGDPLSTEKPRIRFDIGAILEAAGGPTDGTAALFALGLLHEFCHLSGMDERQALKPVLKLFGLMSAHDRAAVAELLAKPQIDVGDVFLRFLGGSVGKHEEEVERQIAHLRARTQVELPYDNTNVVRAIREETDIAALRMRVYNAINDSYAPEVDACNAERVADWCLERGMRLVGGRFSRAFYLDAMLMASARLLKGRELKQGIGALAGLAKKQTLDFKTPELARKRGAFARIGGETQLLLNLVPREEVSQAEAEGVINKFMAALRELESQLAADIDALQSAKREQIAAESAAKGKSATLAALAKDRAEMRRKVDELAAAMAKIEEQLVRAPKCEPAYLAFFQRLFELDAINLGTVNEHIDPFFGEDEHVQRLIRECGHNMYITPNLEAWLRHCRDWIEALPAYARYEIVPKADGGYDIHTFVDRQILEIMYRRHAADWAENIDNVMDSEHVAVARELLVEKLRLGKEADALALKHDISREEAIRQVCKRRGLAQEVGALAALVEASYINLIDKVAECRQQRTLPRIEALAAVIRQDSGKGNLVSAALKDAGNAKAAIAAAASKNKLTECAGRLEKVALKRRRELPCVHVLTTLGPGETEFNVQNWLEESMALYNVSRMHGLEPAVEKRIEDYQRRLAAVGSRVVDELDLQGELYNILAAEALDAGKEKDRAQGVLKLVAAYPEVAAEVSKLAVLIEHEEKTGGRAYNIADASEPSCVKKYLAAHPELEEQAVQAVVEANGLAEQVAGAGGAAKRIVDGNADYKAEKESTKLSMARQRLVKELDLGEAVRNYMRRYLDRLLATVAVRREIIAEKGLAAELDNPRFRYDASGPYKKFHLLYTPSRVDLGASEVTSVRDVSKWIGGRDREAANAGEKLYSLYNVAGVTAVAETRQAEFLKVGENFFSRGGPYYLSLAAGVNIDTIRTGDFEFCRDQWNSRGDRIVLPAGETYGGFCVPKEFTLLQAVIFGAVRKETSTEILKNFGVPVELHAEVMNDMRKVLQMRVDAADPLEWEQKAIAWLTKRYPEYFAVTKGPACVARVPRLANTFQRMGLIDPTEEKERQAQYRFANWVNKKAQGLEEINRTGPFRKVHLIGQLVGEARLRNPAVAPDEKLIGMMSAPYKEGEREDGKEIPITDVRFSSGARKLEIYAGTANDHLLRDIDPEGRVAVAELMQGFTPPADIRMVGTCTGTDILNHVPKSGLEDMKDDILARLMEEGLEDGLITANCNVYGGDLAEWVGIKEIPEPKRSKLIAEIGGKIHLLVIDKRGTFREYEDAVQGIDFLDLGIPDPGLLDLVDDLPKLLHLMRKGRPNSALVFADATSGGRRRTFSFRYANSKRKVKELFALEETAQYGALGLGRDTAMSWREEALTDMRDARALYEAVVGQRRADAEAVYQGIVARLQRDNRAHEAARDEIQARKTKTLTKDYRNMSDAMGRLVGGLQLSQLDFGTWLLLGGMYVLNGRMSAAEIGQCRAAFEKAMARMAKPSYKPVLKAAEVDGILASFVRPMYVPPPQEEFKQVESKIAGSLKAAEEKVARLEKRDARRKQALRAGQLRLRSKAFDTAEPAAVQAAAKSAFEVLHARAMACLGDGRRQAEQQQFGEFLAWARSAARVLLGSVAPRRDPAAAAMRFDDFFSGKEIVPDVYSALCADVARMAEAADGDRDVLLKVAMLAELADAALVVEKTQSLEGADEMVLEIARFFDTTLNNHIFDYPPYHYHKQRGVGYEGLSRQEIFELGGKTHRWLYTFIRNLLAGASVLRGRGEAYCDAWLGDADRGIMPVGVHADDPAQRFWFSYARLREASVLFHENFPLPEIFVGLDPAAIKAQTRPNVAIVYPHGNTTVPVALEQGARLAAEAGINLMLTAFPRMAQDERYGREVLHLNDGLMYIGKDDFRAALVASGIDAKTADARASKVGPEGVLVMASFARPVIAHGIFFHFTHPMRPEIGRIGIPLVQPIVWEAATHLKCRLPEMLKGSGIRTADQVNWFQSDSRGRSEADAKKEICKRLTEFAKIAPTIIVKPEKESGGRRAKILPVRRGGEVLKDNIRELADLVYEISKTDNAAIQNVIRSRVRKLYTKEFLDDMVDRFARIGAPVLLDREPLTPLFSYFRQVLVLGRKGYEISHNITVVSTQGIANVGQGGLLYEYTDSIINERYREDMRREITRAALKSMESQRAYTKANWEMILDEYLAIHPEYKDRVVRKFGKDLTGFDDRDIPYEMGDYMPYFLVDENDNLVQVFDEDTEQFVALYDEKGRPTKVAVYDAKGQALPRTGPGGVVLPIPMFDEKGRRLKRFDAKKRPIGTLVCLKIEPNPGAGLWRPHNDQLPAERKGEGVYTIFRCIGERAAVCREKLNAMAKGAEPAGGGKTSVYLAVCRGCGEADKADANDAVGLAIAKAADDVRGR